MRIAIAGFVLGVCWLQQQAHLPDLRWIWGLPLLVSVAWLLPAILPHRLLMFCLALVLGVSWATWRAESRLADRLPDAWCGVDIRLQGVVNGLPLANASGERVDLQVQRVLTPDAHVPTLIRVHLMGKQWHWQPGEVWQVDVRLQQPHASENPHVPDLEATWFSEGIGAVGVVNERQPILLVGMKPYDPVLWIDRLRQRIDERIDAQLPDSSASGVIKALVVGDQSAISDVQWRLFQNTGIVHLVSVSGSHVTLLAGVLYGVVYGLWRRSRLAARIPARQAAAFAAAWMATFYVLLAGFGIPAQRTLLMLWVVALAQWSGIRLSSSVVLTWALLLVVVYDPWSVLAPGFWLSFGAVGLLLLMSSTRWVQEGRLLAWWRAQWVVTLGLIPPMLMLFGQFSLSSPLANALAIPLIEMLVTPLSLVGTLPGLGFLLVVAAWLLQGLFWFLNLLNSIPLWQQAQPSGLAAVLAGIGALWLVLPRGFPARYLGVVLLLPALMPNPVGILHTGEMEADVLDVGQGLSVVVRTAHHVWLYDTGPRHGVGGDSGTRIVLPWMMGEGIPHLDGLVLSHDDADHTGGAAAVLAGMPVTQILTSLPKTHVLLQGARGWTRCQAGESWWLDGVRFDVLYPGAASYANANLRDNHRSCVIKVTAASGSLLLTGDIEADDEAALLARCARCVAAQVLVAPHHGSRTSSTENFIAAVHPSWVIFSMGAHNAFGHPAPDVVWRYHQAHVAALRTDQTGMVQVRWLMRKKPVVIPWRQTGRRYWQDNHG